MTDETNEPLRMIQMWLDGRALTEVGKMVGLPLHNVDNNYLAHCLLGQLFGDAAPKPYWLEDVPDRESGREMRVLGYCHADADELESRARMYAEPNLYDGCDFERMASKPMPETYHDGLRLGFELRACPVVRKSSSGDKWDEGQEIDAFLSRVWEVDDPSVDIEREEVYRDWLERQLEIREGAELVTDTVTLKRFSIKSMTRRTQGSDREVCHIKRPDATLIGELEVTDGDALRELLSSGIGRHKSFGFGMLKIRPA